jgi:hypothetical protein
VVNSRIALLVSAALLLSAAAPAPEGSQALAGLQQADLRLATTLFRLATANAPLCDRKAAATGLVVHALADYDGDIRPVAKRYFGFAAPLAVEAVVPGSPAEAAGLHADDSLIAIAGRQVDGEGATRQRAWSLLDGSDAGAPLKVTVLRNGARFTATITPVASCDAHAEVRVDDDLNARTDGTLIQVDSGLMNMVPDPAEFASVVAHELSHVILRHPERLTAADVSRGLFKGFGRSARLFKRTEEEADRLSVVVMANAGYPPQAAVRYWLTYGPRLNNGGLGSTHQSWRARAELIRAEVDRVTHQTQRPIVPAWIDERNQPLD